MKKILVFLSLSILLFGNAYAEIAWNGQSETAWTQGDGSSANPYIISSPDNLAYLASRVSEGNTYAGKFFEQTEDFDIGLDHVWRSIGGTTEGATVATAFEGTYNGGNHYIKNVNNNHLFGLINNATIQNLTMMADQEVMSTMVNETNGACVLSVCQNFAPRESKEYYFGGLVNTAKGESLNLTWCNNYGQITVYGSADLTLPYIAVGGLVGISYVQDLSLTRCSNGATEIHGSAQSTSAVGGLIGGVIEGSLAMYQCSSTAAVTGQIMDMGTQTGIGHLVGLVEETASGTILSSYSTGNAYNYLVGQCNGSVIAKGCYVIESTNNWESAYFKPQATTYNCYYANTLNMDYTDMAYNFSWSPYASYCFHSCTVDIKMGTFVSTGEIKSPEFLSRINSDAEYFAMDYDNINSGYPIMKWLEGIRYTVTATCDATRGTVKGGGRYGEGNSVTLTATPNAGCTFVGWSDGNTDNPRSITVTGDATYIAQFTKSTYTIYVNQDCSSYIE